MDVALAIVLVGLLIVLHELGHFAVAKLQGVRVKAFSVGFGPVLARVQAGETTYQLGMLPFGGFVMFDETAEDPRAYEAQRVGRRAAIAVAGVAANLLVAFLVLECLFGIYGLPVTQVGVARVLPHSPAAVAGLRAGDRLVEVAGLSVAQHVQELDRVIARHRDRAMAVEVLRAGRLETFTVRPRMLDGAVRMGVLLDIGTGFSTGAASLPARLGAGFAGTWNLMTVLLGGLLKLVTGQVSAGNLGGPVRVVEMTSQVAATGMQSLLYWLALLSANLAVLNAIPFPGLDGGRLAFLAAEWLARGRRSLRVEQVVNFIGLVVLMLFIGVLTLHDLAH